MFDISVEIIKEPKQNAKPVIFKSGYLTWRSTVLEEVKKHRDRLDNLFRKFNELLISETDGDDKLFSQEFLKLCNETNWKLDGNATEIETLNDALALSDKYRVSGNFLKHAPRRMKEKIDKKAVESEASKYFEDLFKLLTASIAISELHEIVKESRCDRLTVEYDLKDSVKNSSFSMKRPVASFPNPFANEAP